MDRLTQRGAASVWRHPEFPPSLVAMRAKVSAPTSVAKEAIPLRRLALVPEGPERSSSLPREEMGQEGTALPPARAPSI